MSFTYTPGSAGNKDKLRFLIGDTDGDTYIFEDEEIAIALSLCSNDLHRSAAMCCRSVATSRAKQAIAIKIMGDISIDKTKVPQFYLNLADKFEKQELQEPIVDITSFAYLVDELGVDNSERVGDDEVW